MKIGLIGLGKMGTLIAQRLTQAHFTVIGYDTAAKLSADSDLFFQVATLEELARQVEVIWIMIPAGKPVDDVIEALMPHVQAGALIIDGGNSHFADTIRRAETLRQNNLHLLDCGTSGGIHAQQGLCLMIGGNKKMFMQTEQIFKALAAPQGYAYVGPSGAGHYVKMIHNGIEYALLESYSEGFNLLRNGHYKNLDLATVSDIWCHGAVIRSWLLELTHAVLKKDQNFTHISGKVAESGMGQWTADEARKQNIPMPALKVALQVREESRATGGNYATKLIALLRQAFGGHSLN